MKYFIEFVKALVWPITLIILGIMFKSEFKKIIDRLAHVKYRDFEAEFNQELKVAEAVVKKFLL
jgi:hypothetical protein